MLTKHFRSELFDDSDLGSTQSKQHWPNLNINTEVSRFYWLVTSIQKIFKPQYFNIFLNFSYLRIKLCF